METLVSNTVRNTRSPRACSSMESLFFRVVKDGDYKAYSELFTKYYHPLCNYAMKVVSMYEIAEEVVADVFIKLWKNREQIEVHTSFEAYIYRSVRNQSLDYLKLKAYRVQKNEPIENIQWSYSNHYTPYDELHFNELYDEIEYRISRLPRQCQLIFRMNREEGLRYREIAEKLKISIKTVETQMGRALKVLREQMPEKRLVA